MDLQVIDDCLPNYYFKRIQKTLLEDTNFPWYWQDGSNFPMEPDFFQFNHVFIDENYDIYCAESQDDNIYFCNETEYNIFRLIF